MTRCHIVSYQRGEIESPDNFVLLCKTCHEEQPDTQPKDVLKYWLYTRESEDERVLREFQRVRKMGESAMAVMKKEFGQPLLDRAMDAVGSSFREDDNLKKYTHHCINTSAGQGRGNRDANFLWGMIRKVYDWCIANKDRIEEIESESEDEAAEDSIPGDASG